MIIRNLIRTALGLALVGAFTTPAQADSLTKIYINAGNGDLYVYDSADGFTTETLVQSSNSMFSISAGPLANTIYFNGQGGLDAYNLVTNTTTNIGGANLWGNALGEGRDGNLYMGSGNGLVRVDGTTGADTFMGYGQYFYAGDIAVDPTNISNMYGAVSANSGVALALVDRNTGAQTLIGDFGTAGGIWGLGFSLDGTLYAAGPNFSGGGAIYSVNKDTGAATLIRTISFAPFDMATQPYTVQEPTIDEVPEPATLALAGLGAASVAVRRRSARRA